MHPSTGKLRIIVLGYIIRGPLGGMVWHHLQYVLGLAKLGHDVYFLEDSDDYPSCYDPSRHVTDTDPRYGLAFISDIFERTGITERWAYYDAHAGSWLGPAAAQALELCTSADLLLNLSGINPIRPWHRRIPIRAFVDTDPVFTQIRNILDPGRAALCKAHTHFFTFGENIPSRTADCPVDGFSWLPTRQPVVMELWERTPGPVNGPFSTIMQWDSFPALEFDGRSYGMKSESFLPYVPLPGRSPSRLQVAMGSPNAPLDLLHRNGWEILNPLEVAETPRSFQDFIRKSKAEFSVAKHGYVSAWSGWFSERSASYLASGRPVIVQDTGFSSVLPTGKGVISFTNPDEALEAISEVNSNYDEHCAAASDLVRTHFGFSRVLGELLSSLYA
jgi:hypothetical protein